ncbi:hypothetical protein [Companilactobacillus futsaii]|uniref:hypothetical protein n=1 Tax=Companilactobacillus futsaii TaxID=938155 RepID=UPI00189E6154|nr:hypothetical protein [Companilactobacillus futsaii]
MKREVTIDSILKEELKDPEFRREFEIENNKLEIAVKIFKIREKLGWTRSKLATAMGKKVTINIE